MTPRRSAFSWLSFSCAVLALCVAACGIARAAEEADPESSAIWQKVRQDLFGSARVSAAGGVLSLEAPSRAQDAAVVPIAIRAAFPQSPTRYIEKIWLIVDNNPSPIAAVFQFTPAAGRADIETRIRVEQYTHVRAVALMNDGALAMATRYVKASGGCSAPAGKDAEAARANLGKMRFRIEEASTSGGPVLAQLMISHPNDSGLAMDQVTRTYAPPHFVRTVEVSYGGKPLLRADVDFSISENPNFRFYFVPGDGDELEAKVVDNHDLQFVSRVKLGAAAGAGASTSR